MSELPSGWAQATLPNLIAAGGVFSDGDWVESKDQDPEGDVRLIQLADVGDGFYRDRSARFLTSQKAAELGCTYLKVNDVLIARMPDPLGRACLFPGDRKASVTVVDVCIVRPGMSSINPRWLVHTLNAPQMRSAVEALQVGTTRKRISRGNLATIPIPLPPLAEQERIVAAIEEQFSRLDAGLASLDRGRRNLTDMRSAILEAAITGHLVEPLNHAASDDLLETVLRERAADLSARYRQPTPPVIPDRHIPPHWAWASLDALALNSAAIVDGPFGSNLKTSHYTSTGPRVIRLQNIGDGEFLDAAAHISESHYQTLPRHAAKSGDIVCAILGETLPRACIVPDWVGPAIVKADCPRIRLSSRINSRFVWAALNAPSTRHDVSTRIHGVGRPRLSVGELRELAIPVPPREEQDRIVATMDLQLDSLRRLEAQLGTELDRADALRSSILSAAFSGQLVPQDPTDEPASVLLERIAAERASSNGRKPTRKPHQEKLAL